MRSTFQCYLRWTDESSSSGQGTDGAFVSHLVIEAESHREAAQARINRLVNPEHYTDVAVLGRGEIRIFKIEVVPPVPPKPEIKLVEERV